MSTLMWCVLYLIVGTLFAEAGDWKRDLMFSHYLVGLLLWPVVVLYILWKGVR